MKKIGVLTYWGVPNYGAWTQAYALNNVLKQIVGDKAEVMHINYLCDYHWNYYYKKNERLYNSFSYSWNEISHTEKLNKLSLEKTLFDVIVTGSDAIWEFSVPEMGNDPHLIGNNLNTNKLISYAASFGVTSENSGLEPWVSTGLKKYDKITVRDEHSRDVIKKLGLEKNVDIVIDPALLWDFKNDEKIKLPEYKNYFVVYGFDFSDEFKQNARRLADEKGCKLISVGFVNDWCDMSLKMIELRGLEWIGMFKKAEYVITSTFHGLMVGLSFEKNIKFYQAGYVKNRSQTLKEKLNIPDHIQDFEKDIDYSYTTPVLKKMREESLNLLKFSLGEM